MAEKRESILEDIDCSTANVCAILGNFTPDGINIIYKNVQANVLNYEHVDLSEHKRNGKKESVKGGKYVR